MGRTLSSQLVNAEYLGERRPHNEPHVTEAGQGDDGDRASDETYNDIAETCNSGTHRPRRGTMATPILVTGAAGRVGAIGRTVTELLLKHGSPVRAMVRTDDERAQALRDMGAEVVVGDLLDLDSMHRAIAGCETMYFGMSISDTYLAATVNAAAVAKHHGVKAFINMSR